MKAIQDRIVEEANESAEQVIERARHQTSQIIADAKAEAEKITVSAQEEASQMMETRLNRARSMSSLEKRKAALSARQKLVDQVISEAVAHLCSLSPAEKISFYQDILRSQDNGTSTAEVVFSKQDMAISEKVTQPFEGRFKAAGTAGDFLGGLVIRRGRIEENLTFDLTIKNKRSELVQVAAGVLTPAKDGSGERAGSDEQSDENAAGSTDAAYSGNEEGTKA